MPVREESKLETLPFHRRPAGLWLIRSVALATGVAAIVFGYYYVKLARMIDNELKAGPFADTVNVYAAPEGIFAGEEIDVPEVIAGLRRRGYTTSESSPMGWYRLRADAIEIFPGPKSYFAQEPGMVRIRGGKVAGITSLRDQKERALYLLEPELITNISDEKREKRRLLRFSEIPQALLHAVISVEDKRFFHHNGFDPLRIVKAAYVQLARNLWLAPDKRWRRKMAEVIIATHLERKATKEQIFEYYANQVYLGRRGTFSINGFGEGARAFFGKEVGQLSIVEAATLAGLVQRPSYYNPFRNPDRARARRDFVLRRMHQNGYLAESKLSAGLASPLALYPEDNVGVGAQYFIDLLNDELPNRLEERSAEARQIYTTLDLNLQKAAEEAVRIGMENVDRQLSRRRSRKDGTAGARAQVALIALDPSTGQIKALCGGRDYARSQLNHALAKRQPGSAFKPFVYAAALNTALEGGQRIFTPATILKDQPTRFLFGSKIYEPGNFGDQFHDTVTLRWALTHSLNVPTVELAEMVGYPSVVALARRAGFDNGVQPTPSVALGSYDATPLEVAGAYTVFANEGIYVHPSLVAMVRSREGAIIYRYTPEKRRVLDPRVTYLMANLMQDVVNTGTGAAVRGRGFRLPAAGKTGTSRDGWFAGFTSELLCIVWVGFDDHRDLKLEGAKSALPIWTEFMKRAQKLRQYRNGKPFRAPRGVTSANICPESGELAGAQCLAQHAEVFIDGTQPLVACAKHNPTAQTSDPHDLSSLRSLSSR